MWKYFKISLWEMLRDRGGVEAWLGKQSIPMRTKECWGNDPGQMVPPPL